MTGGRPDERIRVVRIIARMNVGGPAYHVSLLSGRLRPDRYHTLLLTGQLGPGEASFAGLATRYGAEMCVLPSLGPELQPARDVRVVVQLVSLMRRFRPHIVHTHTAKAGTVGRVAARIALGKRPIVLHTYHGHVLTGYFGPAKTALFRSIERALALGSDRLIAVSQATVDDLVRLRIAPRRKFSVVQLGLELDRFLSLERGGGQSFRSQVRASSEDCVVVMVGRLVPIKQVDVGLRAVAEGRRRGVRLKLAVVGDGELRRSLEVLAGRLALDDAVTFLGFRDDLENVMAGSDLALLTSANEGTPVALIEASAAGIPSVATAVGGVSDVVSAETGRLVAPNDVSALADGLVELAADPALRARLGAAARSRVRETFAGDRLIRDVDRLYDSLLKERGG